MHLFKVIGLCVQTEGVPVSMYAKLQLNIFYSFAVTGLKPLAMPTLTHAELYRLSYSSKSQAKKCIYKYNLLC